MSAKRNSRRATGVGSPSGPGRSLTPEPEGEGLFRLAPIPMWVYDPETLRFLAVNDAAVERYGYSREEFLGKTIAEIRPKEDVPRLLADVERAREGGRRTGTWRHLRRDGSAIDVEVSSVDVAFEGRPVRLVAVVDVAERELARRDRERTAAQSAAIVGSSLDGIVLMEHSGTITEFNPAAERIFGYRREEVIGRSVAETIVPPSLRERHLAGLETFMRTGHGPVLDRRVELTAMRADGSEFPVEVAISKVDLPGEPLFAGTIRDITERKRAERRLREAEERYRSLVERVPAVVYLSEVGRNGAWLYVSPRIEQMLGYTPEEWLTGPELWTERLHPDDRERALEEEDLRIRSTNRLVSEYRFLAKDDRIVWVRDEADVIEDEEGRRHLWGLLYDVTERRETEQRLRRTDELRRRLLSKLVASQEEERTKIAHDIHDDSIQVMTAVGMRLEVLRRRLTDPAEVEAVEQLARTVSSTITRLRNLLFELRPPALDREGLAAALRLYLNETSPAPEWTLDDRLGAEPPADTRAVLYRIAQEALANVRKHARASMVEVVITEERQGVLVEIRDDGVGFVEGGPDMGRPGHLGLASMRERAELAGGGFRVRSGRGRGTTVEIWVPARVDGERWA